MVIVKKEGGYRNIQKNYSILFECEFSIVKFKGWLEHSVQKLIQNQKFIILLCFSECKVNQSTLYLY